VGEHSVETADVGIWIQNYDINLLNLFKKNIFFINEEWAGLHELSNLHLFDYVVCKSKYAHTLLKSHDNVIYIPFISRNFYNPVVQSQNQFLHFVGRSIQKNTELVLSLKNQLTSLKIITLSPLDKIFKNFEKNLNDVLLLDNEEIFSLFGDSNVNTKIQLNYIPKNFNLCTTRLYRINDENFWLVLTYNYDSIYHNRDIIITYSNGNSETINHTISSPNSFIYYQPNDVISNIKVIENDSVIFEECVENVKSKIIFKLPKLTSCGCIT
jgi:hypothetical protein